MFQIFLYFHLVDNVVKILNSKRREVLKIQIWLEKQSILTYSVQPML